MTGFISVPGRVNLIGEHIDYHDLPVLPMAIQRRVSLAYEPRADRLIHASSVGYPDRSFSLDDAAPLPPGDWGNYLKAALPMIGHRWTLERGINVSVTSDLSLAAGLSSSSALLTGFALALLRVNGIEPSLAQLMELLPDGEQFVGTRGGGMDHAAVLASHPGNALLIHFAPLQLEPIPIPPEWSFLIAHSLTVAEKSGAVKAEYNARRTAGQAALKKLGFATFRAALDNPPPESAVSLLPAAEASAFRHVFSESQRVHAAINALRCRDIAEFGKILVASHTSLRDDLAVSNPALDELVQAALHAGAVGARLTGAGFGGCAIIVCESDNAKGIADRLCTTFYADRSGFVPAHHLFEAIPSEGALLA